MAISASIENDQRQCTINNETPININGEVDDINKINKLNTPQKSCKTVNPPKPPPIEPKISEIRKSIFGNGRFELEKFTRFSECHLWKLMMSFYDRQGVDSWAQGTVPYFITCNSFIGHKYAKVLCSFLRDCMKKKSNLNVNPSEPFYIIELGAGSGKFSFFMVKSLIEISETSDFPIKNIKYIMTDFTEQNFEFWKTHPALQDYIKQGIIDFAIFEATKDTELNLHHSKIKIKPNSIKNPICIIANYLFDTLYHDLFQVENGIINEGLISVGSKNEKDAQDPYDPEIIKRLSNLFKYEPIDNEYYNTNKEEGDEIHLNNILRWYQKYYESCSSGATFLVPIGALRAIRRLSKLSNGKVLLLSGDKGHSNPDNFRGITDPHIAVHGSFSVMVNYHAIGVYFASRGGFGLHNPQEEASLKVSAFVLTGNNCDDTSATVDNFTDDYLDEICRARSNHFRNLVSTFEDSLVNFGPNDFFVIQKGIKEETKSPTIKTILSLLKLSHWDPDIFYKFRDIILDQGPACLSKLRKDLCHSIPLVWNNYYELDKEKDIAFEIGRFYYGIREFEKALEFYTISLHSMGDHHVTFHNMGLCYYGKKDFSQALESFQKSININNEYEKAKTWRDRVAKEIESSRLLPVNNEIVDDYLEKNSNKENSLNNNIDLIRSEDVQVVVPKLQTTQSPTNSTPTSPTIRSPSQKNLKKRNSVHRNN